EGIVRASVNRGFDVVVVEDCCASYPDEWHRFSIENIMPLLATVTTSDAVLAGLRTGGRRGAVGGGGAGGEPGGGGAGRALLGRRAPRRAGGAVCRGRRAAHRRSASTPRTRRDPRVSRRHARRSRRVARGAHDPASRDLAPHRRDGTRRRDRCLILPSH